MELKLNKNWVRNKNDFYYKGYNDGVDRVSPMEFASFLNGSRLDDYLQGHFDGSMVGLSRENFN